MQSPAIFVSCVSPEFRTLRGLVVNTLLRLGYTPIFQEIFGTEPGDLRQVLRDKIDACEGLIQIVGHGYGAEPPNFSRLPSGGEGPGGEGATDFGRVSYTQFEFLYGRHRGIKTWLIFAADGCQRDRPIDQLDLPDHGTHPDPTAHQAERRRLQDAYRQARQNDGHLYHPAANTDQLLLRVEQLKPELHLLREGQLRWQADVAGKLTQLTEAQKITKEKIRIHLLESAERTHQAELAKAEREQGWQRRQQLRDAAETEHAVRLSRIDELAASFAEIEGTAKSTDVFNEMSRILAEEGVDPALAYVGSLRQDILGAVMAHNVMARERNRAELRPLLRSAQLQAGRAAHAEAATLYRDILAVEPDWPEALHQHFWFLVERGDLAILCQGYLAVHAAAGEPRTKSVALALERMGWDVAVRENSTAIAKLSANVASKMRDVQQCSWWRDGFGSSWSELEVKLVPMPNAVSQLLQNLRDRETVDADVVAAAYVALHDKLCGRGGST